MNLKSIFHIQVRSKTSPPGTDEDLRLFITKWAAEVARQLCGSTKLSYFFLFFFIFHLNSVGLHKFLCCFLARSASHTTAHDDSPSQLGHISYSLTSSHVCCFSLQCRRTENLCVGFAHRSMSVFFPQVVRFFQNGAWSWGERVLCRICNALQLIWKALQPAFKQKCSKSLLRIQRCPDFQALEQLPDIIHPIFLHRSLILSFSWISHRKSRFSNPSHFFTLAPYNKNLTLFISTNGFAQHKT